MKHLLICLGVCIATATLGAQAPSMNMPTTPAKPAPPKPVLSPPATATATIGGKTVTITYSSPRVKGREGKIFNPGGLLSLDGTYPVWRAGANAATVLHTETDLVIGGLAVPKGDYSLWVDISDPKGWLLIVNKQSGQWGRTYDKAQNLGTAKFTMSKPPSMVENLSYAITDFGGGKGSINLTWEDFSATVLVIAR